MKLIPTPYQYQHDGEVSPILGFSKVDCQVPQDETVSWGLEKLQEVLSDTCSNGETLVLKKADDPFFEKKNAKEQGYILCRNEEGVALTAQTSIGFLYGLMTLRQLCEEAPKQFSIYDKPQIRFRGNMNTMWAESGLWSYDFGDGLENACQRLRVAIDQAAMAKLNLMYFDAFGYGTDRFPGYNETMRSLSEYGRVRGVRMMFGAYGMSYGSSAHNNHYFGKVYRNHYPYPDGEIYDCIGTYDQYNPDAPLKGRSYGTCLSNKALTDDKIAEIRTYLRATGASVIYMHNMDSDEMHEPLWLGRCDHCRKEYPNDDLYAADGAAGAFAAFYDQMLDSLLPEFPDLIICPVSPGYAYAEETEDAVFEKCRKFWAGVRKCVRNKENMIPLFRELFHQHEEPKLRYDLLSECIDSYGCAFFSSGDGYYSDKIYTPSAAYAVTMRDADLMICANGSALQKPTQLANAEYLWNTDNSAFWNLEIPKDYKSIMSHYNDFREGVIRPEGIYGDDGLLDTSCELIFGKKYGKRIADVYRVRGKNGECPIFTACNAEIWTKMTVSSYYMLWDNPVYPWGKPINAEEQEKFRTRFAECTIATVTAKQILEELLREEDMDKDTREYLQFMRDSAEICIVICNQLTRYMDLYIEADRYFESGTPVNGDICARCDGLMRDAQTAQKWVASMDVKPFDTWGGAIVRRDDVLDFVEYSAGQIKKSILTDKRIPDDRRPLRTHGWW